MASMFYSASLFDSDIGTWNMTEHKRKRISSIEYYLSILQKGVNEARFADNEGFRCHSVQFLIAVALACDRVHKRRRKRQLKRNGVWIYRCVKK
jgi:hypothetical protein